MRLQVYPSDGMFLSSFILLSLVDFIPPDYRRRGTMSTPIFLLNGTDFKVAVNSSSQHVLELLVEGQHGQQGLPTARWGEVVYVFGGDHAMA